MSSDFVHVTLPPQSPDISDVIQDGALEEDTDLTALVENFMQATQLQISLKRRIENALEKKAKDAAEQEENARLAWLNSQTRTRVVQESAQRLRDRMKLAENAGNATQDITSSLQTPSTRPSLLPTAEKSPTQLADDQLNENLPTTPRLPVTISSKTPESVIGARSSSGLTKPSPVKSSHTFSGYTPPARAAPPNPLWIKADVAPASDPWGFVAPADDAPLHVEDPMATVVSAGVKKKKKKVKKSATPEPVDDLDSLEMPIRDVEPEVIP